MLSRLSGYPGYVTPANNNYQDYNIWQKAACGAAPFPSFVLKLEINRKKKVEYPRRCQPGPGFGATPRVNDTRVLDLVSYQLF